MRKRPRSDDELLQLVKPLIDIPEEQWIIQKVPDLIYRIFVQSGLSIADIQRARGLNRRIREILDNRNVWDTVFLMYVLTPADGGKNGLPFQSWIAMKTEYPNDYIRLITWILKKMVNIPNNRLHTIRLFADSTEESIGFTVNMVERAPPFVGIRYSENKLIDYERGANLDTPQLDMLMDRLNVGRYPYDMFEDGQTFVEAIPIRTDLKLFDAIYYALSELGFRPSQPLKEIMPRFLTSKYTR
jgi:hypothetical protein